VCAYQQTVAAEDRQHHGRVAPAGQPYRFLQRQQHGGGRRDVDAASLEIGSRCPGLGLECGPQDVPRHALPLDFIF
jgi:hypothetical protein